MTNERKQAIQQQVESYIKRGSAVSTLEYAFAQDVLELLNALDQCEGELRAIYRKLENYVLYSAHGARGATGTSFQGPHYNPADLCETQSRAVDQLRDYLRPDADAYLVALVEHTADRERERRKVDKYAHE